MKKIIFMLIILECVILPAFSTEYLTFEASAMNRALGGNQVGIVNIWHQNPLSALANPALPSFHNGLAWSYHADDWKVMGASGIEYNASQASYAARGIAFTFPMLNRSQQFGITMDFGKLPVSDESSFEPIGYMDTWDNAQIYGIAVNPMEVYRSFSGADNPWLSKLDVGLGTNLNVLRATVPSVDYDSTPVLKTKYARGTAVNMGALLRLQHSIADLLLLEAVSTYTYMNAGRSQMDYPGFGTFDIERHQNLGYALAASLKSKSIEEYLPDPDWLWFDDLISIRFMGSVMDYRLSEAKNNETQGLEIALLDTFFIRNGHQKDNAFRTEGDGKGWGLKLHYRDLFSLHYNYAKAQAGSHNEWQESSDFGITADILSIRNLIR